MHRTLGELAEKARAELRGPADLELTGVATLASAGPREIAFLANPKYRAQLQTTRAGAVILAAPDTDGWEGAALVTPNPYLAYARVAACFEVAGRAAGIDPSAAIHPDASVDPAAAVAAGAVIGPGVKVDAGAIIGPGCVIEFDAHVGRDTRLVANVTLCRGVTIGQRCLLHPGAVIGADGFGQARDDGERWVKVPQLGSVRIGDDVEIGANTTVDRGALEDTLIENGVKLDNQIQVAHNVRIGAHTAIAGCTAIAGSTVIGQRCMIAGGVGIAGHLEIADDVTVLAMTFVTHSIREKGVYAGSHPMEDVQSWRRNSARLRNLDDMAKRLRRLEKRFEEGRDDE